jgi:hypothetical protein
MSNDTLIANEKEILYTLVEKFDAPVSMMIQEIAHENPGSDVYEDPSYDWMRLDPKILNRTLRTLRAVPPSRYYHIFAGEFDWDAEPLAVTVMDSYNDLYLDLRNRLRRFEHLYWCCDV